MKEIKLTKGKVALVDDEDFEYLNQWKWQAQKSNKTYYAKRGIGISKTNPKHYSVKMHRQIMGVKSYKEDARQVDHKDWNGLNNQKENLRVCTPSQNAYNRRSSKGDSKYKGVLKQPKSEYWGAKITVKTRGKMLGVFEDEKEAAIAYDNAARKYYKEFAVLNFPDENREPRGKINQSISSLRQLTKSKTGFRGVIKSGQKFIAQIGVKRKTICDGAFEPRKVLYLGTFQTKEEAARAFDKKATEIYGEFAVLNFPERLVVEDQIEMKTRSI